MKKIVLSVLAATFFSGVFTASTATESTNFVSNFDGYKNPYFNYISPSELPSDVQNILNQYFGGLSNVTKAKVDRYKYEVETRDGFEVEFNFDGSLKSVESDYKSIPTGVLSNLPGNVYSYISSNLSGWKLLEVEVKSNKIEVELEKGRYEAKLVFDRSGRLLKVKYDD